MFGKIKSHPKTLQIFWEVQESEFLSTGKESHLDDALSQALLLTERWQKEQKIHIVWSNEAKLRRLWQEKKRFRTKGGTKGDKTLFFWLAGGAPQYSELEGEPSIYDECSLDLSIKASLKEAHGWHSEHFYLNVLELAKNLKAPPPLMANCHYVLERFRLGHRLRHTPILKEAMPCGKEPLEFQKTPDGHGVLLLIGDPMLLRRREGFEAILGPLKAEVKKLSQKFQVDIDPERVAREVRHAQRGLERYGVGLPLILHTASLSRKTKSRPLPTARKSPPPPPKTPSLALKASPPAARTKKPAFFRPVAPTEAQVPKEAPPPPAPEAEAPIPKTLSAPEEASPDEAPPPPAITSTAAKPQKPVPPAQYPGRGLLKLKVSDDKMAAHIIDFKAECYEEHPLDADWLEFELQRFGITARNHELLTRIKDSLAKKRDLNQLQIAKGDPGLAPTEPTLEATTSGEEGSDDTDQQKDFRKSRIRTVKAGEEIARFHFKEAGVMGETIFGDPVPHPPPDLPQLTLAPGIKEGPEYNYLASRDGLAELDLETLSLGVSQVLEHEGDVNLTTGDLEFDGDVVIKGFIRDGAQVKATGNIVVNEGITGGHVESKKALTVKGGIIKSTAKAHRIEAGFMESSTIHAADAIQCERNIINCELVAKSIKMTSSPGIFAGGKAFVQKTIVAKELGFSADNATQITMGVDGLLASRLTLLEKRDAKLYQALDEAQKAVNMFQKKRAAQMTKAHQEQKKDLTTRVRRLEKLRRTLKQRLREVRVSASEQNQDAHIIVTGTLYKNVEMFMGEEQVSSLSDAMGVRVDFVAKGGTHIHALPEESPPSAA